jgi:acetylglutamate kinase
VSAVVVKIGGSALTDAAWLEAFAGAVAHADRPPIVVHGGGPDITALSERLGVGVSWSSGRRVTTAEALDVASMVLSGRLNKRIVAALLSAGADAVGLSGEDGGLVRAVPAQGGALGRVGRVVGVRAKLLEMFLSHGIVPVVSPISRGEDGGALNVNSDEVAGAVAAAAGSPELLYVTDVEGVRDSTGVLRAELAADEVRALIATGAAHGGMAVKLEAALLALEAGVDTVRIGRVETLTDAAAGTRVRAAREVALCP